MILAICSKGEGLHSLVEERFGRIPYFVLYDLEKGEGRTLENPGALAPGGAGPKTVQFLSDQKVKVVLAGKVGPKALRALKAASIDVYSPIEGTVEETLNRYRENLLNPYEG